MKQDLPRIVLFTGNGKGKTTAALGMVLRASGHGLKSLIVQFVKAAGETGELSACRHLPGVEIVQTGLGFIPDRTSPVFAVHQQAAHEGLRKVTTAIAEGNYALVVMDEICLAVTKDLLAEEAVIEAIHKAGPKVVIIMTGRRAPAGLISLADTVTEMTMIKHGYVAGWPAQKGVEF
ncbi:MAG: cob(I)yrinic acid a,c-diamide adenosyltransferase [Syntrophales bacterium]|nr:cob(I)yrinic acid a,c-diamide adenosyltransferase [Syntrophales bacterium]MCK9391213.1 cob(I)yrinic acid a,c-diamide adenosyltransferase [Syntrophales bacterium]